MSETGLTCDGKFSTMACITAKASFTSYAKTTTTATITVAAKASFSSYANTSTSATMAEATYTTFSIESSLATKPGVDTRTTMAVVSGLTTDTNASSTFSVAAKSKAWYRIINLLV